MSNIQLQEASQYRRNKQYKTALQIYREEWDKDPQQFNEWDGWSYAYSLKQMKLFQEALEVCRQLYSRYKHSQFINNLYAQCIFYTQIKVKDTPNLSVQKKAVRAMVNLSPPHQEYSLSGVAIFHLCKNLMKTPPVPWQEIESWIDIMDPDLLSQTPFSYKDRRGKMVEYASQQEEWYSIKIRIKGGLEQPKELLRVLEEAQKKGFQWHYQNDVWMERKRAFAYKQLGDEEKAEKILRKVLRKKRDWFLYADLGDVLKEKEEKLATYCQAALLEGKPKMKVNLYDRIAKLIQDDTEKVEGYKQHLLLIARIRMENGWDLSTELEAALDKNEVNLGQVNHFMDVHKKLLPFWEKYSGREERKESGQIKYLHKNGKSGMILGKNGKDYFFGMKAVTKGKKEVQPGCKVEFEITDGFDKKKNTASKMAINVKLL